MREMRETSSEEVLNMIDDNDVLVLALDAETQTRVLHMVVYKEPITETDLNALEEELKTDKELGMTDVSFVLMVASEYIKKQVCEQIVNVDGV